MYFLNINEKVFQQSLTKLQERYALAGNDDIVNLTDAEILRCPGIGRQTFNAIRIAYPFDQATADTLKAAEDVRLKLLELERLKANPPRPNIDIGSIHDVVAARIVRGDLYIKVKGFKELIVLYLSWSDNFTHGHVPEGNGFGTIPSDAMIKMATSFPQLHEVEKVVFENFRNNDDYWTSDIHIITGQAKFSIRVFGEEEAPEGTCAEEDYHSSLSFVEEIAKDPTLKKQQKRLEKTWRRVCTEVENGGATKALRTIAATSAEIDDFVGIVKSRAAARGFTIRERIFNGEHFVNVDEDHFIDEGALLVWSMFFPSDISPDELIWLALDNLLLEPQPVDIADVVRDYLGFEGDIKLAVQEAAVIYSAIAREIAEAYDDICSSNTTGLLQKDIVARIDKRFPLDDGLVRRAVKRWIYARTEAGDMLAVKSSKGKRLRLAIPTMA